MVSLFLLLSPLILDTTKGIPRTWPTAVAVSMCRIPQNILFLKKYNFSGKDARKSAKKIQNTKYKITKKGKWD